MEYCVPMAPVKVSCTFPFVSLATGPNWNGRTFTTNCAAVLMAEPATLLTTTL